MSDFFFFQKSCIEFAINARPLERYMPEVRILDFSFDVNLKLFNIENIVNLTSLIRYTHPASPDSNAFRKDILQRYPPLLLPFPTRHID